MNATRRNRAARIMLGALLAAVGASACSGPGKADTAAADAAAAPAVLVRTTPPVRKALADTLTLYGEVAPDAGASENVSFARPVRIARLLVSAGQRVLANQPLLEVETDPSAVATFQQAQAALTLANKELTSQTELFAERLTTKAQLAAAQKSVADAQASLAAERASGAAPGKQLVLASHQGVVASLTAQQGDRVPPGTVVLQLARSGARRALLGAEPEDVGRLSAGMPVSVTPVFGGATAQASVSQVFAVINPQTRLVDVAVKLMDGAQFMPGTKVRGDVSLAVVDAWVVPASAVLEDGAGAYLFQLAGGKAHRVAVQVRVRGANNQGVTGPITAGQPIVVSGNYELEDGAPVRVADK